MVKKTCNICKEEKDKISKGMCPACYMFQLRRQEGYKKTEYEGKCDNCGRLRKDIHRGLCQSCYRTKYNREQQLLAPLIKCKCSEECEEMIPSITMQGKPAKFKEGHSRKGERNNMYKRGWFIRDGYKFLTGYYGHQNANEKGEIREHVLVMSNHLNRPLFKGELVHHINHNKLDNRIENLTLTNHSKHQNIHNPRKGYRMNYDGVVCIECGADTTYPSKNGQPHWCKHPITKEVYVCERCYKRIKFQIQVSVTKRRATNIGDRVCVKCGVEKSELKSGRLTWHELGGGRYECKRCYDKQLREKKKKGGNK